MPNGVTTVFFLSLVQVVYSMCDVGTPSTSTFLTTSISAATASFCGDKFVFKHSDGLLVCEKQVQERTYPISAENPYNNSLSELFVGSLTGACVSEYGVHVTRIALPQNLVRASRVLVGRECIFYAYSLQDIFCIRRAGGIVRVQWQENMLVAEGTILDVAVHDDLFVRTMHVRGSVGRDSLSLLSRLGNTSESVLEVSGLLMFARGEPRFWLRRTDDNALYLSKFDVLANTTFSLNLTSTYRSNDVTKLFSKRVPLSSQNTLLEHGRMFVVFATATYREEDVVVYVGVFDIALADSKTYGMQYAIYNIAVDKHATRLEGAYQDMFLGSEAMLSATWFAEDTFAMSVAIPKRETTKYQTVVINLTNFELISSDMHPDFMLMFRAPFVPVANAVVSFGAVQTCMQCRPTSYGNDISGFFAYGAPSVTYRRLVACEEDNQYIEQNTQQLLPVQTCARVRSNDNEKPPYNYTDSVTEMLLVCVTLDPLEIIFQMQTGSIAQFASAYGFTLSYTASRVTRVLLSAQCVKDEPVTFAAIYDNSSCTDGCPVRFMNAGFLIYGAVRIESVQQRRAMSLAADSWNRRVLIQGGHAGRAGARQEVTRSWTEHSIITSTLLPGQQIEMQLKRHISVEALAAMQGQDTQQRIVLDAVTVVPVLSQDLLNFVQGNTSVLMMVVYVPSRNDLRAIALETLAYGDDIIDWSRVHASVRVVRAQKEVSQCMYVARLVAVDDNLQTIDAVNTTSVTTGCVFDLALSPQCHIELPQSLTNAASVVGLHIVALTSGCDVLSERSDVTVEFAAFMKISQCPAHHFLDADTLMCAECDEGEPYCRAGQYVRGCLALVHPSRAKTCLTCASPNSSFFPNASRGCDAWQCVPGYYRSGGACARCTSALAAGATACYNTPGTQWQACTAFENEQCVDCVTKPRYSEWTISGTTQCAWQCKDAFFASGTGCEACSTFEEVGTTLAFGARTAGAFYRFQPCNRTAQARAEKCSSRDFGYDLNGTYSADAQVFSEDCVLDCAQNSNTHSVQTNITLHQFRWTVTTCQTCPAESWPLFANGTRLPRQAFRMSESCAATCVNSQGFFAAANYTGVCLFCPLLGCRNGTFWSSHDNCTACRACTKQYDGSVFVSAGALDDAQSCTEQCPQGSFLDTDETCKQHSPLTCRAGLEYAIAGTHLTDALCGTCADCSGARETVPCTVTENRQCASCGALDTWSSFWSRTGCELMCKTTDGYTKLTSASGRVCRKCKPCAVGYTLPPTPSTCTCLACDVGIPSNAVYTKGCAWTCPLYHIARVDLASGSMLCEYTIKQTSNERYNLRSVSPVVCPPGQRLTQDARPAAYASLQCETCVTPAGLDLAQVNVTWTFERGCAWKCAWNLQKQQTLGLWRCEALVYIHSAIPGVHITPKRETSSFSGMHVLALAICALVVFVVSICFFGKMVRR